MKFSTSLPSSLSLLALALSLGSMPSMAETTRTLPPIFPSPQDVTLGGELISIKQLEIIKADIPEEAYVIEMNPNGLLTISASSKTGEFYAMQSLSQLLGHIDAHKPITKFNIIGEQLPAGTVTDQPDIPLRGVVEGFYGQPWSHEARLAQIEFYGRNKLNTYIYGPKDDPYHSKNWREAYPAKEAAQIGELAELAKACHVKFYWAIHPGADIHWTDEDMHEVIKKFERMYQLGVRHFAVFFDDITGEGTKAEMQAKLMNMIQLEFVDQKPDVGQLLICPTQYNRAWSQGDYLPTLGEALDSRIHIMWTGDTVVHDISLSGQNWVKNQVRRPTFVWWNSPCTDYVRDHLCLGRVYGLDQDAEMKTAISGFTSNPMDKPEASKIALFSVADYCWNTEDFQSDYSWKAGITRQFEDKAVAMFVFAQHNCDPGPSYHNFRREESVNIAPSIKQLLTQLELGMIDDESRKKVALAYAYLSKSCEELQKSPLPAIEEVRPWLASAEQLGLAGSSIMLTLLPDEQGALRNDYELLLPHFVKAAQHLQAQEAISDSYETGITVGSALMQPTVNQLVERFDQNYMMQLMEKNSHELKPAMQSSGSSSMNGFASIATISNKESIGLQAIAEVHGLPSKGSIKLLLPAAPEASLAAINIGNAEMATWAEVSALDKDGKAHKLQLVQQRGAEHLYALPQNKGIKMPCTGLILSNVSDELQAVQLKQFAINASKKPSASDPTSMQDGKLSSSYQVTADMVGKPITIPKPKEAKEVLIIANMPCKTHDMEMHLSEEVNLGRHTLPKSLKEVKITPHQAGFINEIFFR